MVVAAVAGTLGWMASSAAQLLGGASGLRGADCGDLSATEGQALHDFVTSGSPGGGWRVPVFLPRASSGWLSDTDSAAYALAVLPFPVRPGDGRDEAASRAGLGQHPFILGGGCAADGCPPGGFGAGAGGCRAFVDAKHARLAAGPEWPPPRSLGDARVTEASRVAFTLGGRVPHRDVYKEDRQSAGASVAWHAEVIDEWKERFRDNPDDCSFADDSDACGAFYSTVTRFPVSGKRVLVLAEPGDEPWLQAMLLAHGAAAVVTIAPTPITCSHAQVTVMTAEQAAASVVHWTWQPVDAAFSYSSVEHAGLGRFGDHVYGWGDAFAVARVACWLKPGGTFALGVPMGSEDGLEFNAGRVYGPLRLGVLADGWEPVALVRSRAVETLPPFASEHGFLVLRAAQE